MQELTEKLTDSIGVFVLLRAAIHSAGGQKQFAEQADVSAAHVSQVMAGFRQPGPALLRAVGMRRVVGFAPVKEIAA